MTDMEKELIELCQLALDTAYESGVDISDLEIMLSMIKAKYK